MLVGKLYVSYDFGRKVVVRNIYRLACKFIKKEAFSFVGVLIRVELP